MGNRKLGRRARKLLCEQLESRCLLSAFAGGSEFHAVLVAGDPKGTPADSPTNRVDQNTTNSPFAGVGSLQISASSGTYICTGTLIDPTHVLTAGHCVDIDDNGAPDITGITFNLNHGGNLTSQIPATAWETRTDFSGFASPSVNDDLAVITLDTINHPLPAGVPTYDLAPSGITAGAHLYMVGYGQSGDGVKGYYVNASFSVKRVGENIADAFYGQDDAGQPAAQEVFRFDFDGKRANTNAMGGGTLGNDKETTLGGGDSGGPSFILKSGADPKLASSYLLAGINTFTQGFNAPKFGSLGGGINVGPYIGWITGPRTGVLGGSGGSAGGGTANSKSSASAIDVLIASLTPSSASSIQATETPINSGTNVAVGSPPAQSAASADAKAGPSRTGSVEHPSQAKAAGDEHDLLAMAEDAGSVADDGEHDDFAPAVDEILRRWSV